MLLPSGHGSSHWPAVFWPSPFSQGGRETSCYCKFPYKYALRRSSPSKMTPQGGASFRKLAGWKSTRFLGPNFEMFFWFWDTVPYSKNLPNVLYKKIHRSTLFVAWFHSYSSSNVAHFLLITMGTMRSIYWHQIDEWDMALNQCIWMVLQPFFDKVMPRTHQLNCECEFLQ